MVSFNPKDHVAWSRVPIIEVIEKKFKSIFIGEFECFDINSELVPDTQAHYFYNPNPDTEKGHSNYFRVRYIGGKNISISNGIPIASRILTCVQATDGELLYSHYLHDFRESKDKSVWIDGGFHYTRTNAKNIYKFVMRDGKWIQITGENLD